MKPVKIILADDHQLFRDGIRSLLEDENIKITGEASTGKELLEMLKQNKPDLIILDITMPDISGIATAKQIQELYPEINILILSMHNEEEFIINAIKAGAKGYLPKDIDKKELLHAIYTIQQGDEYFSKDVSEVFLKNYIQRTKAGLAGDNPILTSREIEIVKLVSEGLRNQEIANKLFISVRTVDAHKNNIMRKLKLKSTVDIVKFAIKNNLIEL